MKKSNFTFLVGATTLGITTLGLPTTSTTIKHDRVLDDTRYKWHSA